jgi:hypothetical protein
MAECVSGEIAALTESAAKQGHQMLFVTHTFPKPILEKREAQKRWNSWTTNWLRAHGARGIAVWERHQSGAWHVHWVGFVPGLHFGGHWVGDRIKGFRFVGDEKSRIAWKTLRAAVERFGLGRSQWLPVRVTKAVGRYVAKYLTKSVTLGAGRVVSFFGYRVAGQSLRRFHSTFAWYRPRARVWRRKVAAFMRLKVRLPDHLTRIDIRLVGRAGRAVGRTGLAWMWRFRSAIMAQLPDDLPESLQGLAWSGLCRHSRALVASLIGLRPAFGPVHPA